MSVSGTRGQSSGSFGDFLGLASSQALSASVTPTHGALVTRTRCSGSVFPGARSGDNHRRAANLQAAGRPLDSCFITCSSRSRAAASALAAPGGGRGAGARPRGARPRGAACLSALSSEVASVSEGGRASDVFPET